MITENMLKIAEKELHLAGLFPDPLIADGKCYNCLSHTKKPSGKYCITIKPKPTLFWQNYRTDKRGEKDLSKPGLRAVTLRELRELSLPPQELLMSPFLTKQSIAMLYAPRGSGKTYVALSIGIAIATGKDFIKFDVKEPNKVLYVDGEMPANAMKERVDNLVDCFKIASDDTRQDNFILLTHDLQSYAMPKLATPEGQAEIEPFLKDVALVIIDNLATLCRAGRENETESWLPLQGWLLDLRRRGISVLIIHHAGKNGDQRGTSAKEDIMDTVINLRRPKDYQESEGARFEVHFTKARNFHGSEAEPFELQLCDVDGRLSWIARNIEDSQLDMVRKLLQDGYSVREVAEELGLSKSKVSRIKQKIAATKS